VSALDPYTTAAMEQAREMSALRDRVRTTTARLRAAEAERDMLRGERAYRDAASERIERALGDRCTGDLAADVERLAAESREQAAVASQRDTAEQQRDAFAAEAAAHLAALRDLRACLGRDDQPRRDGIARADAYLASIDGADPVAAAPPQPSQGMRDAAKASAFWRHVTATAKEVAAWPEWKRRERLEGASETPPPAPVAPFAVGQRVRVVRGVFASSIGEVTHVDGARVGVLPDGQAWPVWRAADEIEAVADEVKP
jgi:hypothetical protein